ncbi:hypothetical protein QEG98_17435 [Myxococcus sp. MxC21-1]|uniref:hypothetical protein n=1 Tax=Myxococcus sp. MxC21-1 TaxID=3041439 RepID=UPI00292E0DF3|nr:hypothetical protein [Myxococcus sp. MxC21-1]WNZ65250.1 hypothetical protein QEG98_17435 [Myxococcus sp. MxC21-1]
MARISLTASVALAAPGGRNRNRLRPASHGVADFRLRSPGGPQSRCHRPAPFPALTGGDDGFHFAPEVEPVELTWRLLNTGGLVRAGKLELFTRYRKAPLWSRELSREELLQGEHRWAWDGRVPKSETFPDGVVTVEHSPYKLKLTLQGSGLAQAPVAWTFFHVLVAGVDLELGEPRVLSRPRDRELTQSLKRLPAPGEKAEIRLVGNVFKTKPSEMSDDTDHQLHRKHWGNGPELPLFARAWLKDSRGNRVDAPKALGRVRFLWDWEDETEAIEHHAPTARAFLKHALDRHCSTSQPKGDNAHRDVGGKRGAPSLAVFPRQAGYAPQAEPRDGAFPFRVTPCNKRGWAAYSRPGPQGRSRDARAWCSSPPASRETPGESPCSLPTTAAGMAAWCWMWTMMDRCPPPCAPPPASSNPGARSTSPASCARTRAPPGSRSPPYRAISNRPF